MLINYTLATVFFFISYQLFTFAFNVKRQAINKDRLVVPPELIKWFFRFKISMAVAYLTAGIWQFYIGFLGNPLIPIFYLSVVMFINLIVLWNILQVKKHFKLSI